MATAYVSVSSEQFPLGAATQTHSISTPSANNLIVVTWAHEGAGFVSTCEDQNGDSFTLIESDSGGSAAGSMWYKVADGDETSITVTFDTGNKAGEIAVVVLSGVDTSAPLDASNEDITYVNTSTTTVPTGSATPSGDGHAIFGMTCERSVRWDSGDSVTIDVGTIRNDLTRSSGLAGVLVADLAYTGTASKSATFTTGSAGDEGYGMVALFKAAAGGGSPYSLTADKGSYTTTGSTSALTASRKVAATKGSYSTTGSTAGLAAGRKVAATKGSYSTTGIAATLTYVPAGAVYTLIADKGTYSLSGVLTGLVADRRLSTDKGTYSLSGYLANLIYSPVGASYILVADKGTFNISGYTSGLAAGRQLSAVKGTFNISGYDPAITAQRWMATEKGTYALTSEGATLLYSADGWAGKINFVYVSTVNFASVGKINFI